MNLKTKITKTKLLSLILVLVVSFCCLLLSGCNILGSGASSDSGDIDSVIIIDEDDDQENKGYPQIVLDKFKIAYRSKNESDSAKSIIKNLANNLVNSFASTFGYGKGYDTNQNVYYYDSIRYQAYEKYDEEEHETYVKSKVDKCWLWSFGNVSNKPIFKGAAGMEKSLYEGSSGAGATYTNATNTSSYSTCYNTLYSECMEVVLYEILLGSTDYQNIIVIGNSFDDDGYPVIYYRGQNVIVTGGKPDFSSILTTLRTKYFDKTTYYGFSLSDAEKIKQYIINYVIGENALTDKDGIDQLNANRNYKKYVDDLVDTNITDDETDTNYENFWIARNNYKDSVLAISSNETGYFSLIQKAEYQSLVYMPTDSDDLISTWIAFEADKDLTVNFYYRYYDGTNVITTTPQSINIKAGKYNMMASDAADIELNTRDALFKYTAFDNNSKISASTAQSNELNRVYKSTQSLNGFGSVSVLNEKLVNSPFIEIVLDVEKEITDAVGTDYGFKVAIFNMYCKTDRDYAMQ